MHWIVGFCVLFLAAAAGFLLWRGQRRKRQLQFIQQYAFKRAYTQAIRPQFPEATEADFLLAEDALRQYFVMHWKAPLETLFMPSRLADALWHEFLLDTRRYQHFCEQAFGPFFHHIPSESTQDSGTNLRRLYLRKTWNVAVASVPLMAPKVVLIGGVPLLFALDAHARLTEGYIYDASDFAYWHRMMRQNDSDGGGGGGGCGGSGGDSSSGDGGCGGGCGGD